MLLLSCIITVLIATIYCYFKHSYNYFQRRNIPYLEPSFPFGNINLSFFHKYGQELQKLYETVKRKGTKYGGFYILTKPVILPTDPEMIKNILTKDFQHFYSRGVYHNENEFITQHLFSLSGTEWKTLRTKFTPTFSSGKIKNMFGIMMEKTKLIEQKLEELSTTSTSFEAKELSTKITTDMFCSVGFGIDSNSLVDNNAEFPKYAEMIIKNNWIHTVKFNVGTTLPNLFKRLNIHFIKPEFQKFFIKAISEVVDFREKNGVDRPDFINLLIKLKNNIHYEDKKLNQKGDGAITMEQLIAQCFIFFIGGFDTSASTINYCLFELTQNQEIQKKLREEIHSVLKKHDGKMTYEAVMDMQYLEKVISETLRKYPSLVVLNRECTENYIIPDTNSVIEKGTSIMISVLGLHHDSEYYPDPGKFDPERFSDEERAKRPSYSYLPFGNGPKNCIGVRLGLLQVKIAIISLLNNYKYTLNPKTKLPLEFKTESVLLATVGDIWINVCKM